MGPQKDGVGTSWIELATSWMFFHQQYLPVRRPSCNGHDVVITPEGFDAAKDLGAHLHNLQVLVPEPLTPKLKRGKVASLYLLGYKQFTTGIHLRPEIPCQRETIGFLGDFLKHFSIDMTPKLHSTLTDNIVLPEHWRKRQLKFDSTRKKVAKVRNARH